jgi:hypothetical protein
MGVKIECDGGCGAAVSDLKLFKEFGIVKKVWYCQKCEDDLKALYDERDELHTKAAMDLRQTLLGKVSNFKKKHPNRKIPDAPE